MHMKIKVGDWVKREHADGIARVISIEEDMAVLYTGGVQSCEYLEELTKLPIKFKGFDIVDGKIETTKRYSKLYKQTLFFIYDERIHLAMIIGINFIGLWKFVDTPEQARDWLELQYATMLAKARGLI